MCELLDFLLKNEENFRRVRLPSLYSDFRAQQTINPDGFNINSSAWETGLAHATQAGLIPGGNDILSLRTGENLLKALETKEWGRPLALTTVIATAIAEGRMIPLQHFLSSPTSLYQRRWLYSPSSFVSWSWRQLSLIRPQLVEPGPPNGTYVLVRNVEEAGAKVMKALDSRCNWTDRVIPINVFATEVAKTLEQTSGLTNEDLKILLVYLSRDKKYLVYNARLVKLSGKGDSYPEIAVEDDNIASLKSLMQDLNVQLKALTLRATDCDQKARSALANRNRTVALTSLRSKKLYESILVRRSQTLSQLEGIFTEIEEAANQVAFTKAIKAGSNILKGLNAEVGGAEAVEQLLSGLSSEIEQVGEVSAILSETAQTTSMVDDGAVDEELELLESQCRARDEEKAAMELNSRLDLLDCKFPTKLEVDTIRSKEKGTERARYEVLDGSTSRLGRLSIDNDESRVDLEKWAPESAKQTEAPQT